MYCVSIVRIIRILPGRVWFGCRFVFFFKQKTAYEMRISDWSSDVCSSDLQVDALAIHLDPQLQVEPAVAIDGQFGVPVAGRNQTIAWKIVGVLDGKARLRELLQHRLPSLCCSGRFAFTLRQHPVAIFDTLKVAELGVGQIERSEERREGKEWVSK